VNLMQHTAFYNEVELELKMERIWRLYIRLIYKMLILHIHGFQLQILYWLLWKPTLLYQWNRLLTD